MKEREDLVSLCDSSQVEQKRERAKPRVDREYSISINVMF